MTIHHSPNSEALQSYNLLWNYQKDPICPRLQCHSADLSTHFQSYFMQFPLTLHQHHGPNTQFSIKKLNLVWPAHISQMIISLLCICIYSCAFIVRTPPPWGGGLNIFARKGGFRQNGGGGFV